MAFNLKTQIISKEIVNIVASQVKGRDLGIRRFTPKHRAQLKKVLVEIEQHTLPPHLVRKKLKGNIGHGIFLKPTAKPIEKGDLIAPYAGVVTIVAQYKADGADYAFDPVAALKLTKEEQKKYDPKSKFHPGRLYALKLDAEKKGNFTRFINHSATPNAEAWLVNTKENPYQIMFFAKKRILPGEQILICYEEEEESYWTPLGIEPFPMTPRTFLLQ